MHRQRSWCQTSDRDCFRGSCREGDKSAAFFFAGEKQVKGCKSSLEAENNLGKTYHRKDLGGAILICYSMFGTLRAGSSEVEKLEKT
jgi:hypothetical protein